MPWEISRARNPLYGGSAMAYGLTSIGLLGGLTFGQASVFAQRVERDLRPELLGDLDLCLHRGEERRDFGGVVGHAVRVGVDEALQLRGIVRRDPARADVGRGQQAYLGAVLVRQAVGNDLELQRADRPEDGGAPVARVEDLDRPFLAQLRQARAQLLGLHRRQELGAAELLGREERQTCELQRFAFGERVAQADGAVVGDADDVARVRLRDDLPALREEGHGVVGAHLASGAAVRYAHAALEAAGAYPHERHPVAVRRVHVGLDLEHHSGKPGLVRRHRALAFGTAAGWRREIYERIEHFADAEVVDGRA